MLLHAEIIYFMGKQNAGYNNLLLETSKLQNNFQSVCMIFFARVKHMPKGQNDDFVDAQPMCCL